MDEIENSDVAEVFNRYPDYIRPKLMHLRQLILDTASGNKDIIALEETLKWGEPSYLAKGGSTIRMDWKSKNPDQYVLYFNCKTKLIDTFKALYANELKFQGNRAIVFNKSDPLSVDEIKHCILLSLTYHSRKHLPMLGV